MLGCDSDERVAVESDFPPRVFLLDETDLCLAIMSGTIPVQWVSSNLTKTRLLRFWTVSVPGKNMYI